MTERDPMDPHNLPSERVALPGYLLRIRQDEPSEFGNVLRCDFDLVHQVVRDGVVMYTKDSRFFEPGPGPHSGETDDPGRAELAVAGFAKWDGCTQFEVSPVHIDDKVDLDELLSAIAEARRQCAKRMGRDIADEYDNILEAP